MNLAVAASDPGLDARARQSGGSSAPAIYGAVARLLSGRRAGGVLVDIGCGSGMLWRIAGGTFERYIGVDAVKYAGFPQGQEWLGADLNSGMIPLPEASAEAVVAVEVIEHLENPRALVRELVRIVMPGGIVVITTPNLRSWLSLLTLVLKGRFAYFQDGDYPAHMTPVLEIDLLRMAAECGLADVSVSFSEEGRIILTPWHYPRALSGAFPRACSDNLILAGRRLHG